MKIRGYDIQSSTFSLQVDDSFLVRNYSDFIRLNRIGRKNWSYNNFDGIPVKSFKKMMKFSWVYNESVENTTSLGWNISLLKSIQKCEEWFKNLTSCKSISSDSNHTTSYEEFTWFFNNTLYKEFQTQRLNRRESEAHSKLYQQYFCSSTNMQSMLQYSTSNINSAFQKNTLFIEPSCGDSRIMKHFMHHDFTIIGCEIDDILVSKLNFDDNIKVQDLVINSDFLLTCRDDYVMKYQNKLNVDTQPQQVVVTGCPPYSPVVQPLISSLSVDSEFDSNFDIIESFFLHAAHVLEADKIVFLVSKRCGNPIYIANVTNLLNNPPLKYELLKCRNKKIWKLVSMVDSDNQFEISSSGRYISQPSVIQVWCGNEMSE